MIFVIDDDEIMAECVARAAEGETKIFRDGYEAMEAISDGEIPELIFLDVMLTGPDGFTFLNEMMSYVDTMTIPIVIVSSIDFSKQNLQAYNVVGVLVKDTMKPEDIKRYALEYTKHE